MTTLPHACHTSYGDILSIHTSIAEWHGKSLVRRYLAMRGETLIMACDEVRIFAGSKDDGRMFAWEIPAQIPQIRQLRE